MKVNSKILATNTNTNVPSRRRGASPHQKPLRPVNKSSLNSSVKKREQKENQPMKLSKILQQNLDKGVTYQKHQHAAVANISHISQHSVASSIKEKNMFYTPKRNLYDFEDSSRYVVTENGPSGLSLRMSVQTQSAKGKEVKELQEFLNLKYEPDEC